MSDAGIRPRFTWSRLFMAAVGVLFRGVGYPDGVETMGGQLTRVHGNRSLGENQHRDQYTREPHTGESR